MCHMHGRFLHCPDKHEGLELCGNYQPVRHPGLQADGRKVPMIILVSYEPGGAFLTPCFCLVLAVESSGSWLVLCLVARVLSPPGSAMWADPMGFCDSRV